MMEPTLRYVKQIEQLVGSSCSGRFSYGSISGSASRSSSRFSSQRVCNGEDEMPSNAIPAVADAATEAMPQKVSPDDLSLQVC